MFTVLIILFRRQDGVKTTLFQAERVLKFSGCLNQKKDYLCTVLIEMGIGKLGFGITNALIDEFYNSRFTNPLLVP
jgi:hypothetical protein